MEALKASQEKVICPYNSSHHILRARFNTHIIKCKKNYPNIKLVECDFDYTHKVREAELQYHHENCPSRKKIEAPLVQDEDESDEERYPIAKIEVDNEEDWDNAYVPSYDPNKYCENNEIIRQTKVESRAKRKNFRQEERNRWNKLLNEQKCSESGEASDSKRPYRSAASCPLPEPSRTVSAFKETPTNIAELMKRVETGANKRFVQK